LIIRKKGKPILQLEPETITETVAGGDHVKIPIGTGPSKIMQPRTNQEEENPYNSAADMQIENYDGGGKVGACEDRQPINVKYKGEGKRRKSWEPEGKENADGTQMLGRRTQSDKEKEGPIIEVRTELNEEGKFSFHSVSA